MQNRDEKETISEFGLMTIIALGEIKYQTHEQFRNSCFSNTLAYITYLLDSRPIPEYVQQIVEQVGQSTKEGYDKVLVADIDATSYDGDDNDDEVGICIGLSHGDG